MTDIVERLRAGICDDPCRVKDIPSGCACAEAAARIEQLEAENASLAAWQCEFTDGKTGIVYGEGGGTYCAMAKRVQKLEAALREIADMIPYAMPDYSHQVWKTARAALEGEA